MISFLISMVALVLGYRFYGRFVERKFGPDDRVSPAVSKSDGVDFIVMPGWKVFMIQFLNIAGTGPIFGAIMGAQFGPVSYLWIVLGCIFAGAVHDYMAGMLSMRHDGEGLPELAGRYLGRWPRLLVLAFTVFLLLMVGTVFVYSPAQILSDMGGSKMMWVGVIFVYYIIATMLPIDKIIGKIYPLFAFSLLFMAAALMAVMFINWPAIPEVWDHLYNMGAETAPDTWTDQIFPCLFITIACGAISGFHATQTPLMARCTKDEHMGRPMFYGAMITEGIVALIWASVASWFFYNSPETGYSMIPEAQAGFRTSAADVVTLVCNNWLGTFGAVLAILGVVAAPITSGDTAFRSARLIVAEGLTLDQRPIPKRLLIGVPLFLASIAILVWQIENADGFKVVWQYFGWANQTLAAIMLWTATVYMVRQRKCFWITLIPALFMTAVCSTFFFVSKLMLFLPGSIGYPLGMVCLLVALVWFALWYRRQACAERTA